MTTITLPPEIEQSVARQAERQGTTIEWVALDTLRQTFAAPGEEPSRPETMYDFMQGFIGTVDGSSEAYSENCGEKFAEGMAQKQREGMTLMLTEPGPLVALVNRNDPHHAPCLAVLKQLPVKPTGDDLSMFYGSHVSGIPCRWLSRTSRAVAVPSFWAACDP